MLAKVNVYKTMTQKYIYKINWDKFEKVLDKYSWLIILATSLLFLGLHVTGIVVLK